MTCRKPMYIPIEVYNNLPKNTKALITKLVNKGCMAYTTSCIEYDSDCNCIKRGTGYFITNPDIGSFELPIRHYMVDYELTSTNKARVCIRGICVEIDLNKPKPATAAEEFKRQGIEIDLSDMNYIARLIKVWIGQWEYRCNQINKILEYIR